MKKQLFIYFISLFIFSGCFFGVLFYYDPLKIWHINEKYSKYLQNNMRQQATGIINNYEFDSIILGTSMLENTSAKEAGEKLGGKFMNISLSGSNFYERSFVLEYALRKKEIKKIIYSLDEYFLNFDTTNNGIEKYIYDTNKFNDIKIYLNDKYLKCLLKPKNKEKCMGRIANFDRPNEWSSDKSHSNRFGGLQNWFKAKNNDQIKNAFSIIVSNTKKIEKGEISKDNNISEKIKFTNEYLDKYLINFVKKHPNSKFILIVPPYSRAKNAIDAQYDKPIHNRIYEGIKYLTQNSAKYPNLKIYAWGDMEFPDDIANYKDLIHYAPWINSKMLEWISKDEGLLTTQNLDAYWNKFSEKSINYDVISIGKRIEKYLKENK
ncbi:MAG: hypothetical protein ACTTIM_03445 [Campylobacter sp.]